MSRRHPVEVSPPTRRAALLALAAGAAPCVAPAPTRAAEACPDAAEAAAFAILDRYIAIVNGRAPERMREVCVEDYIQHSGRSPNGIAAQVENFRRILAQWTDLVLHADDRIFGDGKVVARNTFTATHSQTVLGVAPTGRKVSFRTIDIWRVADGKFAEHWDIVDFAGLEKQLRGN